MDEITVDVAIIGAGTAGMRAYREVSQVTDAVLLVEGERLGTTCARVGCMPSKLLIAAAEAAHQGRHAGRFGIHFGQPRIDGPAVMRRVRAERDRFVGFVVDVVERWPPAHRLIAHARFAADDLLELSDGRSVRAKRVVIATGSRPAVPAAFSPLGDRAITSDELFEWETLPSAVAVFGAGAIGLELGQALHRLGVRVVLFGKDDAVGPLTDPEVLAHARALVAEELDFRPDADVTAVARTEHGIAIRVASDSRRGSTEQFDCAVVATGRRPNVDRLGLENTSLALDPRGVPVHDPMSARCGASTVFIAGDATNTVAVLHEAADEGFVAGYNAAHFPDVRRFARSTPVSIVFSDPQLMLVGESHAELGRRGVDVRVGSVEWREQGRARVMGADRGLLRVYGEADTGKFLGAEMIGPRAEHLAHLLAWARQSDLSVTQMLERPFYHPVLEEGVRTALRDLNFRLGMGPQPPPRCIDCGPGG